MTLYGTESWMGCINRFGLTSGADLGPLADAYQTSEALEISTYEATGSKIKSGIPMPVYLTPDLGIVHPTLPAIHVYAAGDVALQPTLNLVQDWMIPLEIAVINVEASPSDAQYWSAWRAQVVKQCLEAHYGLSHAWGCWVKGQTTKPAKTSGGPDDVYCLVSIIKATLAYRTLRSI